MRGQKIAALGACPNPPEVDLQSWVSVERTVFYGLRDEWNCLKFYDEVATASAFLLSLPDGWPSDACRPTL